MLAVREIIQTRLTFKLQIPFLQCVTAQDKKVSYTLYNYVFLNLFKTVLEPKLFCAEAIFRLSWHAT